MPSMQASVMRSLASRRFLARRVLSRASVSASTSRASRSSNGNVSVSGDLSCSSQVDAKTRRRRAWSFSRVGSLSMVVFLWVCVSISRLVSVVVVAAAHILVRRARSRRLLGCWQRLLVEVVLKDGQHVAIAARASEERACTGSFDARVAVLFREPEQAEARAVSPLRMSPLVQDCFAECAGVGSQSFGPAKDARRRPFCVSAMRTRHVLGLGRAPIANIAAHVTRDAGTEVEDLDRSRRCSNPKIFAEQRVRRRVEVVLELDMIV